MCICIIICDKEEETAWCNKLGLSGDRMHHFTISRFLNNRNESVTESTRGALLLLLALIISLLEPLV